jgi:hypothetical protein
MTEQPSLQRGNRAAGWRMVNIDPAERVVRLTVGVGAATIGILLLTATGSVLATVLAGLLVLAGLQLVITGALGHCPIYAKLGYSSPRSQRGTPSSQSQPLWFKAF